jgi:hypothetical protein
VDNTGRRIEKHDPKRDGSCIASIKANGTGRNLQVWERCLVVCPPSDGVAWEQLLGRLHRPGQKADEVFFDVFVNTDAHQRSWNEAMSLAAYEYEISGQEQKLIYANKV